MDRDRDRYGAEDELAAERAPDDDGVIGSEAEEPGPGRDTRLTDPDPVASSTEQPRTTVAMSDADPERTRLGAQESGAAPIGGAVDVPGARSATGGDSGVIGSDTQEPGPGRDTRLTDPDPGGAEVDQPRTTAAMSDADPERTRLGVQEADAEPIGAPAPELADEPPPEPGNRP
jgi:hypothetical protein